VDRETRLLRERLQSLDDAFDASQAGGDAYCSAAIIAQTTTVTTYPTTASAMYAVIPQDIDGAESEGSAATYVPNTGAISYALNLGTQIPPSGTNVICHAVGGRFCFRYDG
jgi:hypothetical protein